MNSGIIFVSICFPLRVDEKYNSLLWPNVWYKKENNKADEVSHINIHLPISTNKNMGINAIN